MKFRPSNFIQLPLATIVLFLSFSCNKDSDLLAEYVIEQPQAFMVNDVVVTLANSPIVIEPLSNDTFKEPEKVTITEVTPPKMGTAEVQEDNTVVYTPNTDETGTDEFDYTTTVTNSDDTVSTETGSITVTVTPTDKTSPITGDNVYYVTTTGKSSNNGSSEALAWSIQYAFSTAKAGDVVYIKAGNYGALNITSSNSGTSSNPIKFIGYTSTPGDLVSNNGSTFNYGESLNPNKMPYIKGTSTLSGIGIDIQGSYVEINNFQITDYMFGLISKGKYVILDNIITNNNGEQNNNTTQTGRGFHIYGDNTIVENCFSLNSNAEAINIKGAHNCIIRNTKVYSDNRLNPGGYYIGITGGASGNLVENCLVYRDKDADLHQGHGYVLKDKATNNIIKNSKAYNTGIEVNFSGVYNNSFEDMQLYGSYSEDRGEFSSGIRVINGAHDNYFKNIYIEDSRYVFNFHDFDDGFVNSDGDRDEAQGGNNNVFENIVSNKSNTVIALTTQDTPLGQSTSSGNKFKNCTFSNVSSVVVASYHKVTGFEFSNCTFENIKSSYMIETNGGIGNWNATYTSCKFISVGFPIPL
ncbi:MAG: Ig-like domain-containing protein [Arenibacter algicola]